MSADPSPTDFIPPELEEIAQLLPTYEILSFIAKGGMGAVYLARQKSLDREVAIKILPRHFGEDAEFRASFQTEAKSMAKLNHPNLIGIYDFGQVDGMLYIIMEMVHGESLYHASYGKIVDPKEAGRIVSEICHGLANAHQQGILHRDIKPANILLDRNASPKIGDFGLARPVGDHESDSAFGTPGYTAPEVVHNPTAVDESTDIYSVGAVLYELLTSKLPERPYMPAATLVDCDPRFDKVIRKAMNSDPILRYRSAESMAEAIDEIINDNKALSASNRLITAASAGTAKPAPQGSTVPPVVKTNSGSPFIRNIIIIVALLAAIYGAWNHYNNIKVEKEAENARITAENEQKKSEEKATLLRAKQLAASRSKNKPKLSPPNKPREQLQPRPPLIVAPTSPKFVVQCKDLDDIHDKCDKLIRDKKDNYEEKFTKNIKDYERDLRYYLKGLPNNRQQAFTPSIRKMENLCTGNRIPNIPPEGAVPPKVTKIFNDRLERQDKMQDEFLEEIEKLRSFYQKNLRKMKKDFESKGLDPQAGRIQQEIDATSSPGEDFIDFILDGN